MSRVRILPTLMVLSCAQIAYAPGVFAGPHDALIAKHATAHGLPESLVRRIIQIESRGNARAVNSGNYGLMQIRLGTARAMGYRGTAQGLLDADTNMNYAVKYLAGAYRAAGCNESRAVSYYQRGYYGARRAKCPIPMPAATQIAERPAQKDLVAKPAARIERAMDAVTAASAQAAPQHADVLMPRVVQTQTISRPLAELKPAAKPAPAALKLAAAAAEPIREPAQTVATAPPMPRVEAMPAPEPATKAASEPAQPMPPAEMTLKDFLTRPIARSKPEPVPAPKETIAKLAIEPKPTVADGKGNTSTDAKANPAWASMNSAPQTAPWLAIAKAEPNVVPLPLARPRIEPTLPAVAAVDAEAILLPAAKRELAPEQEERDARSGHSRRHKRVRGARLSSDAERVTAVQQFVTPERTPRRRVPQVDSPDRHRP